VVQQVGEPLELYNTPANRFVAGFIGSPAMNFADVTLVENGGRPVAEAPGLRIGLPGELAARARTKVGRKATLGIRPEDIHIASPADSADHCFDANVEVVEQLGSEILLDMRVGPALMVASVEPTVRACAPTIARSWRSSPNACTCLAPRAKRRLARSAQAGGSAFRR
jgi:multiple sugar transport system ATP-binding protein